MTREFVSGVATLRSSEVPCLTFSRAWEIGVEIFEESQLEIIQKGYQQT